MTSQAPKVGDEIRVNKRLYRYCEQCRRFIRVKGMAIGSIHVCRR